MRQPLACLLAAGLAGLFALTGTARAQQAQPRLAHPLPEHFAALPGAKSNWLDTRGGGDLPLIVAVELDGVSVNAVIDTGAPFSVIDDDWAFEHSYAVSPMEFDAGGQPKSLPTVPIRALRFSGAERLGGQLKVANLNAFRAFGLDVPLILGNDFLSCCALELDYEHARARLLASGARPIVGYEAPLHASADRGYVFTTVQIGGKPIDSILVDTGGGGSLVLSEANWAATGLPAPPTSIKMLLLSGMRVAGRAQLDVLMLGGTSLGGVGTTILPGYAGVLDASRAGGTIGGTLLRRFHVVIDVAAGRMILGARDSPLGPDRKSTSGLQLAPDDDAALIVWVLPHSPAEALGLKSGERICSIDGKPGGTAPLDWTSGMPGQTVRLTLCDKREITLTLAEFY